MNHMVKSKRPVSKRRVRIYKDYAPNNVLVASTNLKLNNILMQLKSA